MSGCASSQYQEYMDKGNEALKKENYSEAVQYFEKAAKVKSNEEAKALLETTKGKVNIQKRLTQGEKAQKEKKFDNAIDLFTKIIEKKENDKEYALLTKRAKESLETAKTQKETALLEMAHTALTGKKYITASKYFTEMLDLNPKQKEAKKLLKFSENMKNGSTALIGKKYDEAISLFTIALDTKPDDEEAKKRKEEALTAKKEAEAVVSNVEKREENSDDTFPIEYPVQPYVPAQDNAKVQFVNSMNNLINYYNLNVSNQIKGMPNMTSPTQLMVTVEYIYRESLKVYVPFTEYQPIMDNWLKCLKESNVVFQKFKDLSNGDISALNEITDSPMTDYYNLTVQGLNSIQ